MNTMNRAMQDTGKTFNVQINPNSANKISKVIQDATNNINHISKETAQMII